MKPIELEIAAHYEAAKQAWKVNRDDKETEETLRVWEKLQRMIVSPKPAIVAEARARATALLAEKEAPTVVATVKKVPSPEQETPKTKPVPKKKATAKKVTPQKK